MRFATGEIVTDSEGMAKVSLGGMEGFIQRVAVHYGQDVGENCNIHFRFPDTEEKFSIISNNKDTYIYPRFRPTTPEQALSVGGQTEVLEKYFIDGDLVIEVENADGIKVILNVIVWIA